MRFGSEPAVDVVLAYPDKSPAVTSLSLKDLQVVSVRSEALESLECWGYVHREGPAVCRDCAACHESTVYTFSIVYQESIVCRESFICHEFIVCQEDVESEFGIADSEYVGSKACLPCRSRPRRLGLAERGMF